MVTVANKGRVNGATGIAHGGFRHNRSGLTIVYSED